MSEYTEFFLSSPSAVAQLECIAITHPSFNKEYYICRNRIAGVTVTLEDSSSKFFGFYPMSIKPMGSRDDLEQGFTVTIGDAGDTLNSELKAVYAADTFNTKPSFVYRAYRSDVLTTPLYPAIRLEIGKVSKDDQGFTFEARAPGLNVGKTGQLYRIDTFEMLRGLV